jgi:hypothetical protein
MIPRQLLLLAAAIPTALAVSCSAAPAAAPSAAPVEDATAACTAVVALNATIPPGADPDAPAPAAAEMQAWAASVAAPYATLRDSAPHTLNDSVAVLGGVLDQARQGRRIDVGDEKATAATTAIDAWCTTAAAFRPST